MYCATRLSITCQPAITTSTVVKLLSRIEQQRDAVDAEVVVDVEALDPRLQLHELEAGRRRVEAGVERQRDQEPEHRADERDPARAARVVAAGGEHREAGDDRHPDRERK